MPRNRWTKLVFFVVCLTPLAWLGWRAWSGNVTANPIEFITHLTGEWALRFILFTLAVTPLRRLLRLPDLIRFRRMLGLYSFFYASLHFVTWLWLDKDFNLHEMWKDVVKRTFIAAGFAAFVLMAPLAVTSTKGWVQRLGGRQWQRLHRLVYLTAILGVMHYYWLVKSDIRWPLFYGTIVALLLASRLAGAWTSAPHSSMRLRLAGIQRETKDAVTLRFPLPSGTPLRAKPGQFLTFDWVIDGRKLTRSYSISSSPLRTDFVEVTVKRQGLVSSFLDRDARVGLTVEAHGPFGQFCFDKKLHRNIVLFAGGSGITPLLSMLRYIEAAAVETEVLLFYAVRSEHDVIFKKELERLTLRLPHFRCVIVASRPGPDWRGPRGHVDRERIAQEVGEIGDRTFFLCGPAAFMETVKEILASMGAHAGQIRQERFTVGAAPKDTTAPTYKVEFVKSGGQFAGSSAESLLAIAESHNIDIPYSCRVGQCGTCATRVLEGEVEMETEEGLEPPRRAAGYRLMCVGRARGDVRLYA
ncbi:MAG TPA: ferric reductase-like transmembrane domain-containing protein [Bryobacteraceae bacterium]|nr:ferric reductase-like transmembrane domain-containing protein [Bryobacteraceae bacterium]